MCRVFPAAERETPQKCATSNYKFSFGKLIVLEGSPKLNGYFDFGPGGCYLKGVRQTYEPH